MWVCGWCIQPSINAFMHDQAHDVICFVVLWEGSGEQRGGECIIIILLWRILQLVDWFFGSQTIHVSVEWHYTAFHIPMCISTWMKKLRDKWDCVFFVCLLVAMKPFCARNGQEANAVNIFGYIFIQFIASYNIFLILQSEFSLFISLYDFCCVLMTEFFNRNLDIWIAPALNSTFLFSLKYEWIFRSMLPALRETTYFGSVVAMSGSFAFVNSDFFGSIVTLHAVSHYKECKYQFAMESKRADRAFRIGCTRRKKIKSFYLQLIGKLE